MNSKYILGAVAFSTALFPVTEVFGSDMVYEVQPGDTFSKIVQKLSSAQNKIDYKMYYSLLTELNKEKFDSLDIIFPGDKIILPTEKQVAIVLDHDENSRVIASEGPMAVQKYKVQKGDTLSEIAKKYIQWSDIYSDKGTLSYLLKYNPQITDANFIRENQVIKLPSQQEIAKTYKIKSDSTRLPSSDKKVLDKSYKDKALNPDFSFNGLKFYNMPKKYDSTQLGKEA